MSCGLSIIQIKCFLFLPSKRVNLSWQLDQIWNQLSDILLDYLWEEFVELLVEGKNLSKREHHFLLVAQIERDVWEKKSCLGLLTFTSCVWVHLLCCCCLSCCHYSLTSESSFIDFPAVTIRPRLLWGPSWGWSYYPVVSQLSIIQTTIVDYPACIMKANQSNKSPL